MSTILAMPAGEMRSPWREKICTTTPSSGERTSDSSRLRRALSTEASELARSISYCARSFLSVVLASSSLHPLARETLLGEAGFKLLLRRAACRIASAGEFDSLSDSIDDFSVASSKAMSVTRVPVSTVSWICFSLVRLASAIRSATSALG